MPMPAENAIWPPKVVEPAYNAMVLHDAWYVGDPTILNGVYAGDKFRNKPSQYAGGVVGTLARFWWGKPTPSGESRVKLHLPLPADIATMSADLLFSEPPQFILPNGVRPGVEGATERTPQQMILDRVANKPSMFTTLLEAAEVSSALGGVYLRCVWDKDRFDEVRMDVVHADNAVPTFRYGELETVTFWRSVVERDGDTEYVWRHLEVHERGRIEHALFKGSQEKLGLRIPLTAHPATEWLEPLVGEDGTMLTGIERLTATYIPNQRPNRLFRKDDALAPLGRSDFAGIEHGFDAIDEAWTSWARDVRLSKARIIVPNAYLENMGRGRGAFVDTEREVYEGLEFLTGPDQHITMQQFAIRVAEHERTISEWTRYLLRSAGYSPASVGDAERGGVRTAREVEADTQMSERTRDKKAAYWKAGLAEFITTMLELQAVVYSERALDSENTEPEVRFPAESQQDPEQLARTGTLLAQARAASVKTLVQMQHPDWDGVTVDSEVERIYRENGINVAEPDAAVDRGAMANLMRAALNRQRIEAAPEEPEPESR